MVLSSANKIQIRGAFLGNQWLPVHPITKYMALATEDNTGDPFPC